MTDETKQSHTNRWKSLNFAGTIDWRLTYSNFPKTAAVRQEHVIHQARFM